MPNWPTEPVIGNKTVIYLNYIVYSRDPADTASLRTTHGATALRSPAWVRDNLSISETALGFEHDDADRAIHFPYPPRVIDRSIVDGAWEDPISAQGLLVYPSNPSDPGNPYWWPNVSVKIDYNVDWFEIDPHPSIPIWGAGRGHVIIWSVTFLSMGGSSIETPGPTEPPDPLLKPMMKKCFVAGFELFNQSAGTTFFNSPEGFDGIVSGFLSRDASRTPDGIGYAQRSLTLGAIDFFRDTYVTPIAGYKLWERFYIRIRRLPTTGASNGVGFISYWENSLQTTRLRITSSGQITIWNSISAGAPTLTATSISTIPINVWKKVDVLLLATNLDLGGGLYRPQINTQVFVNGLSIVSGTAPVRADTASQVTFVFQRTRLSNDVGLANDMELDIDDLSNQEHPSNNAPAVDKDVVDLYRMDWILGSHVQRIRPISLNIGAGWTGDFRSAMQLSSGISGGQTQLNSVTASSKFKVNTELTGSLFDAMFLTQQLGVLTIGIGAVSNRAGLSPSPGIGYDTPTTGEVIVNPTTFATGASLEAIGVQKDFAQGRIVPLISGIGPLSAAYVKKADATSENLKSLQALAQFAGSWGPEDDDEPTGPGFIDVIGIHNGPYFTSFMALETPPPLDALAIQGGTYTGNGTGQDIVINLPAVHWLLIRRVDSSGDEIVWFSSMIDAHNRGHIGEVYSNMMLQISPDVDNGTTVISVVDSVANSVNKNGATYQIVAICDIGSRIMLNGAFSHRDNTSVVNTLFRSDFTPEFAFLCEEKMSASDSLGMYVKGPGHTGDTATRTGATNWTTSIATFGLAQIQSLSGLHTIDRDQVAYSAWRQGSVASGCEINPILITTYTGNGAGGTRSITVDLAGRRPLLAFVGPATVSSGSSSLYFRDPSHTGSNSSSFDANTQDATHIVGGGIDTIQVGTSLNTNLQVYNMFIIPAGDTTAGNNGWGINGAYGLCEPGWDPASLPPQYLTPPDSPSDIAVIGSGGIVLSGAPAITAILNPSGLYTIVPGQTHDVLLDRQSGQTSVNVPIPNPFAKTGFIGG